MRVSLAMHCASLIIQISASSYFSADDSFKKIIKYNMDCAFELSAEKNCSILIVALF